MEIFQKIENDINAVKEWNIDAGNTLHAQLCSAQNHAWSRADLAAMLKSDNDVADEHYVAGDPRHTEIREIQDAIISFYGDFY